MLGHLSIGVRDLDRAARFYDAVVGPVGWVRLWSESAGLGYGPPGDAALANGGKDDGPPGLRPHFGPDCHACFVFDPEGWKLAALHRAGWNR